MELDTDWGIMMLHNKEIKQFFVFLIAITLTSTILGFTIHILAGFLMMSASAVYWIAFYIFTKKRYQRIARISEQLDLVLHNTEHLYIADYEEGELSVLQCEITKMTRRIQEQNMFLKKQQEQLADSMADIAHQLRTPLTSLTLILSLLEDTQDEAEHRSLILEAKQLFVQMDWLLNSLLKLSRLDAGIVTFQHESINLRSLIIASLRPFQLSMDLHNIQVELAIDESVQIQGDFAWLSEALQNIIKNCMENSVEGGSIVISCTDTVLFTELLIHDNGEGFDKEDLAHLFDRFYRGKNASACGYGIGLALCKMIITNQNGIITAKNHVNGGAVFHIRFSK